MSISNINFSNDIKFRNNPGTNNNQSEKVSPYVDLPFTKRLNYKPAVVGLLNGFCWFGAASLLNKGVCKLLKKSSNNPVSLVLSGGLGMLIGYNAYKVAKDYNSKA